MKLITKLRADRDTVLAANEPLLARMEAGETLTEDETRSLDGRTAEAATLNTRISELMDEVEQYLRERSFDARVEGVDADSEPPAAKLLTVADWAAQFTASTAFTGFPGSGEGAWHVAQLALVKSVDGDGKPFAGVHRAADAAQPTVLTPLLDATRFEPVAANAIEYVRWGPAPEAGVVAEGAVKPEATLAVELISATLEKAAHHVPITQEALEDIPRMEAIVKGQLVDGVRKKAESLAVGHLVADTNIVETTGGTLLAALRRGIATVQLAGFNPTTSVINPMDYADIDIELIEKTLNGAKAFSPLWQMNTVPAAGVPAGAPYVGDFRSGMTTFARSEVQTRMTDSHAAEFISNILRVLAEQRVLTVVTQPAAITKCTVVAVP